MWPASEVSHAPGILVLSEPTQLTYKETKIIKIGDFKYRLKADFQIEARILSTERYRLGIGADAVPIDLALGWKEMSDSTIIDTLEIDQYGRWYMWRAPYGLAVSRAVIEDNSSNFHMAPASSSIRKQLLKLRRGEVIRAEGYLVDIIDPAGDQIFTSSLSRSDTGGGACEVVLVTELAVIPKP